MKRKTTIRKVANASLAFLISASPIAHAMDDGSTVSDPNIGAVEKPASEVLRDHDYYKAKLQELEDSTARIHEEVDRILAEFRKNMEEYYQRTREGSAVITIQEKVEKVAVTNKLDTATDLLNLTEEEELKLVQQISLQTAEKDGVAGTREILGWELAQIEDDGNCLYGAIVHQMEIIKHPFLEKVPNETLPRDSLRLRIEGKKFKDGNWAGDKQFKKFVTEFDDVILAVMDTRSPQNGYVCYYLGNDKQVITHVPDMGPVPSGKLIIKIATTGTHYLSVTKEPSEGFRQIEIAGTSLAEKTQNSKKISMVELTLEDQEKDKKVEDLKQNQQKKTTEEVFLSGEEQTTVEPKVEDNPSSQSTGDKKETVEHDKLNSSKVNRSNGINTSYITVEIKKDGNKSPTSNSSEGDGGTTDGTRNALKGEEGVENEKALTVEDLKKDSKLKALNWKDESILSSFDWNDIKPLNWSNPCIATAADHYCKTYNIIEVTDGNIGSIIRNINLIYLFQKSEAKADPSKEDIANLSSCLHSLSKDALLDDISVRLAIAKYVIDKRGEVIPNNFRPLKINEFEDANGWWQPGKKVVSKSCLIASPKKANHSPMKVNSSPMKGNSSAINNNITTSSKLEKDDYCDLETYKKGGKKSFLDDFLEQKSPVVIIFDHVEETSDHKTFVKGDHGYRFDNKKGIPQAF